MKSRRTQNESLFGADFGPEAKNKSRDRYSQWRSLSGHVEQIFFTKIKEEEIGHIWFQQDGATCHTAEATLVVLRPVFENHIISRRADIV